MQEDFIDSYANLTVKSLMLLKWFSKSCEKVPYVLKTDDDVFINLKNLHALVTKNKKTNLLMGTLICGATPIRDPYNKWFSSKYMYGKKRYPNYLSGTGMEIQISVIKISLLQVWPLRLSCDNSSCIQSLVRLFQSQSYF